MRDAEGFGACQQPRETMCLHPSDCPENLVCRFGGCTNECEMDRDCPNGALCVTTEEGSGCVDPSDTECHLNSDCGADSHLICARDQRCRPECVTTRDCRDGRVCDTGAAPRVCVPPDSIDGGVIDGGVMDGAVVTDGEVATDGGAMAVTPPRPTFTAGGQTTCTVDATSTMLSCFGSNAFGQAGDGTTGPSATPGSVASLAPATLGALGVGEGHVCASTDKLYCWGDNRERQLGTGSMNPVEAEPRMVSPSLRGVVSLGLGRDHTCAVSSAGLWCWGSNSDGQLCDGTIMRRTIPTPITFAPGHAAPVHVVAGAFYTCILFADATVECCGRNDLRQLGVGDRAVHRTPTRSLAANVVRLTAGGDHTCVVDRVGVVRCWGDNTYGQIGTGSVGGSSDPVAVTGIGVTEELALGFLHTCSLSSTGAVFCWGENADGQVGVSPVGWPTTKEPTPKRVTSLVSPVVELRAGSRYTCARLNMGGTTVTRCFGHNDLEQFGAMGPGGPTPQTVPW